jgi:tetratricopeptide (TPR) repeat protein
VEYPEVRSPTVQTQPQFAHNDYLNTLCEWGLAGAGILAAAGGLLYFGAFKAVSAVRKEKPDLGSKQSDRTAFVVGAAVGLAGLLLHSVVENNMEVAATVLTAATLMALLAAQWRFVTERYWKNPGNGGKIALTLLAVVTAGYLAVAGIQRGREAFWLWRADTEKVSLDQTVADLQKARECDPTNAQTDMWLGEAYRRMSNEGNKGYEEQGRQAIRWFSRAMELDSFDPIAPLRIGMCLDWMERPEQATRYFRLATKRDPNNAYIAAELGRHYVALRDYATAKKWYQHSLDVNWSYFAWEELQQVDRLMADPLTNPPK